MSIFSVNAQALSMNRYGVKEYNGWSYDQAFGWTGADRNLLC